MAEDLFEECVKFLNATLDECVGKCGTFRTCDGREVPIVFTLGGNQNDAQEFSSRRVEFDSQDIIINDLDQAVDDGGTFREWLERSDKSLFKKGDQVLCDDLKYTLMAPNGDSIFDFTDPYRCSVRLHVKCTGSTT